MRISTASIYESALNTMLDQQALVLKSQNQVSSGVRVQNAADDPVAAAQLQSLDRQTAQATQFGTNAQTATTSLNLEDQALGDTTTLLQSVRDLIVQANSSALTASDRQNIAAQIKVQIEQLQGIANRQDGTGNYLFAGYSTGTAPFVANANGTVSYQGDGGQRQIQIDSSLTVIQADSGQNVFQSIPQGNGTFTVAASASNTGAGTIDTGTVTSQAAWVPGTYTLAFNNPPTTWTVSDSLGNSVASGNYTSGAAIAFPGAQLIVSGTPAAGDTFTIAQASHEDAFTSLSSLQSVLSGTGGTPAAEAQMGSSLNASLQQIDQALNHITTIRAQVGARLTLLSTTGSARQSALTNLQTQSSGLRNIDYATAVSQMTQQYVGLQAAQQSFASIHKLSLFNYL